MSDKKYADGVRFFERKDNQPEFVLGALFITPKQLLKWAENNPELCDDYKGDIQVKFQVKKSKDGKAYIDLDTYKRSERGIVPDEKSDLPF